MTKNRLLRINEVTAITGLPRSSLYAEKSFPDPVRLGEGRRVAWVETEVDEWIAAQIARREEKIYA